MSAGTTSLRTRNHTSCIVHNVFWGVICLGVSCQLSAPTDEVLLTFSSPPHTHTQSVLSKAYLMECVLKACTFTAQIIPSVFFFKNSFLGYLHDSRSAISWVSCENSPSKFFSSLYRPSHHIFSSHNSYTKSVPSSFRTKQCLTILHQGYKYGHRQSVQIL